MLCVTLVPWLAVHVCSQHSISGDGQPSQVWGGGGTGVVFSYGGSSVAPCVTVVLFTLR